MQSNEEIRKLLNQKEEIRKLFNQKLETTNEMVFDKLLAVLADMKECKPADRSERARYMAIAITDMEKIISFFSMYCV